MNKTPKKFKINGHDIAVGDQVSGVVEWPGGRRTTTQGALITVHDGEAFIESSLGPVAAILDTVEPA